MFLGEFSCLGVYFFQKWRNPRPIQPESNLKTKINPVLIAVPAIFDICGSTVQFIALTMVAVSVYQMMRGLIVVITAVMSVLILGKKQFAHHWLSVFMIVTGVAIVGIVGVNQK